MEKKTCALVLAGGTGTRMKSPIPKVCFPLMGKSIIEHVIDNLRGCGITEIGVVTCYGEESVRQILGDGVTYCRQSEPRGTLDALKAGKAFIAEQGENVLVVCGDSPLCTPEALSGFIAECEKRKLDMGILSTILPDGGGYGRIVRNEQNEPICIFERRDAEKQERYDILDIREINSGTYVFDSKKLLSVVDTIGADNAQKEYYLTDTLAAFREQKYRVDAIVTKESECAIGVNTRYDLSLCEAVLRARINKRLMEDGVSMTDPEHTYIDEGVLIGAGTLIEGGCTISGKTEIGENCHLRASRIEDCTIGSDCTVTESVLEQSKIGSAVSIGPFTHLRPDCVIHDNVKLGNFVEIKNSTIGEGTKASHHAYVGDAKVGKGVNIGCGVIFANYDGVNKHKITVGDHAFLGSNATLVAPLSIGAGAFIAAGSTVTIDIPAEKLVIARSREVLKERKK